MELLLLDREILANRNLLLCLTSFPRKPEFKVPGSGLLGIYPTRSGPCFLSTILSALS